MLNHNGIWTKKTPPKTGVEKSGVHERVDRRQGSGGADGNVVSGNEKDAGPSDSDAGCERGDVKKRNEVAFARVDHDDFSRYRRHGAPAGNPSR